MSRLRLLLLLCLALPVHATTLEWRRLPIPVYMTVGVERVIHLPQEAAIGLPSALNNPQVFRALSTGGSLYLMALQAFDQQRLQIRLADGRFILLDVAAAVKKAPKPSQPLTIVLPDEVAAEAEPEWVSEPSEPAVTPFDLIRYAMQSVHSPKRLVDPVPGITIAPVAKRSVSKLYDNGAHLGLVLIPLRSWAAGGLYVTAIRVENRHSHDMVLSPIRVQGRLVASAFYRRRLKSLGKTTLAVVTEHPFPAAIGGVR
jgi:integrating conjugative element protein (TIGR03749 family)